MKLDLLGGWCLEIQNEELHYTVAMCAIEKFLALLPCTCVLQPKLVHLYHTFSLLPNPLPTVAFARLRLLYSLFYRKHINHIQVLSFGSEFFKE
jgi:hypothetical protein